MSRKSRRVLRRGSHAVASGKVAREAAVYPSQLCRAILRSCARQLRADGRLQPGRHGVQGLGEKAADSMISDLEQQIAPEILSMSTTWQLCLQL